MLDNHMQQGNLLNIDPRRIVFTRVMDMNDRALRNITIGLGGKVNGVPREEQLHDHRSVRGYGYPVPRS